MNGAGKSVRWGAFGLIVLLGFGLFGCAYHERREFVVVPGAKKVWFNAKFLYDSTMTYEVADSYPATQSVDYLKNELSARGWVEQSESDSWLIIPTGGEGPKSEEHLWTKSWTRRKNEVYTVAIYYFIIPGSDICEADLANFLSTYRYWETGE